MKRIFDLINAEKRRQSETLMMIPSENYTYKEVRNAVGSVLMHKYAEGQPNKRYYQGMNNVDKIELLCEQEALKAFGLSSKKWGVNVQAYSGTPANLAIYNALLTPGDRILALYLPDGGHLSHGWQLPNKKISFTSKIYNVDFYHVDPKTNIFNYKNIAKLAKKYRPKLIISGGTATPREIDHEAMGKIAKSAGAHYLADVSHEAGLIAGGANKSPFPHADVVMMTTHKTLRGPRGALIFSRPGLENAIDFSVFPGTQGGPHIHTIAGIAIALNKTQTKAFKTYASQTVKNAQYLSKLLANLGFNIVSGGTDKHLVLVDLRNKKIDGWSAAWALEVAGIIANRNTIPNDTGSAYYPSGLRLGTPAITAQGMKKPQMKTIAKWIDEVITRTKEYDLKNRKEFKNKIQKDKELKAINSQVKELCKKIPIHD